MDNTEKEIFVNLHLQILKQAMKEEGLIFGIVVDKNDLNNSKLAFVDKNKLAAGITDGITVSITDLNEGLL